ncbi:MAG: HD domain-containing protein [Candidatus Omnitrophota bacterium]|nr:HD domain-containing protein [Candidatus Omnitrophota bacterium]
MKKINFGSFQTRLTLALIAAMFFAAAMSNILIYKYVLNSKLNDLRDKLMAIAQTGALALDADILMQVPLKREGMNTSQYREIAGKLEEIQKANSQIKYIYAITRTEKEGVWQFIVDPSPAMERTRRQWATSYPGDRYNAARFPEMLRAFEGPSADKELETDEWGVTLSGYAPIRDKEAKAVAVLGVDISAEEVYLIQQEAYRRLLFILLLGVIISLLLGMLISKGITKPVEKLVEGTRRVSHGDLHYTVKVKGNDEISELAESFNQMAKSLAESQGKLLDYFYRVVESLVRALEAKDPYTKGHSERVADYARSIAVKMGLPEEKIKILREIASIHDIGKLGISENILNKKEKLTDEELRLIRNHPLTGEEILKPLRISEEMLSAVRSHHERHDALGYPDKINGDNINIFAAIVSAADAYDAMTSCRAYRNPLSKEEAILELKKNSGTQFNPKVIEAFLQILD